MISVANDLTVVVLAEAGLGRTASTWAVSSCTSCVPPRFR